MKKFILVLMMGLVLASCGMTVNSVVLTPDQRAYVDRAMAQPLDFQLPNDKTEEAWGRIQSFVGQYSSMKIQTATPYVLETYNPQSGMSGPAYGYHATKAPAGNAVNFSVRCWTDEGMGVGKHEAERNAHLLAFYAVTGELKPELVIR